MLSYFMVCFFLLINFIQLLFLCKFFLFRPCYLGFFIAFVLYMLYWYFFCCFYFIYEFIFYLLIRHSFPFLHRKNPGSSSLLPDFLILTQCILPDAHVIIFYLYYIIIPLFLYFSWFNFSLLRQLLPLHILRNNWLYNLSAVSLAWTEIHCHPR